MTAGVSCHPLPTVLAGASKVEAKRSSNQIETHGITSVGLGEPDHRRRFRMKTHDVAAFLVVEEHCGIRRDL